MSSSEPTDVSAEELNRRLREQFAEISVLAGGLAHEIKNPLSTIRLNLELLAEDFSQAETPRERRALAKIAVVEKECQRLQGLLDDFLRYARIRPLRLEAVDLNREVERVLDFFAPQAREGSIDMVRFLDPNLPGVLLDRESFYGALLNLVLNAQQAMPEGGQLMVRTRVAPAGVALDLIDNGRGMDEKTLSQIFQAFFSTRPGGSGLGLPTARKVVQSHGGSIRVESAPGRGTHFTIELPVPPRIADTSGGRGPQAQT